MSVNIIHEPERWSEQQIGTCYYRYFKIFKVEAENLEQLNQWAEQYSILPHMKSRGNCGDTGWQSQKVGDIYEVTFIYLVDSSD